MLLAFILAMAVARVTPPPTPPPLGTPSADSATAPSALPSPSASPAASPTATPSGPRLTVSPTTISLNPAQQQTVLVSGASAPLTATLDQKLVTFAVDPNATGVTITATQQTGSDTLHLIDANGARADIPIRVAFNAGTIVGQTTLKVTGNPLDPGWLARQVERLVTRLTQALPGAQTTIGTALAPSVAPLPGAQAQVSVPVQIAGNGQYFDQAGTTVVNVQNVSLDPFAPPLLFYDDDPEHIIADGVLFRGTVTVAQPTRLYYYHDDASDPRRLFVALSPDSQDPTEVQLIDGSAGPNVDVMSVGDAVTKKFLLVKPNNEGVILDLPQDAPYLVKDVSLSARQGAAGNLDIRVLSGGPVVVTVLAASPGVDPSTLLAQPRLPGDGHHRTGIFRLAGFGSDALSYAAGGPDATLDIGDRDSTPPNVDPSVLGRDYGDYGVMHTLAVTLANPGDGVATAYLYLRPLAGIVRSSFLVDGSPIELGCVRVATPYLISAFSLQPRQTYRAVVQTMTDGGSFYPIEVGVTGTQPQPSAPPINAPDGCFPKPVPSTVPTMTPSGPPPGVAGPPSPPP